MQIHTEGDSSCKASIHGKANSCRREFISLCINEFHGFARGGCLNKPSPEGEGGKCTRQDGFCFQVNKAFDG